MQSELQTIECPQGSCQRASQGRRIVWQAVTAGFAAGILCASAVAAVAAGLPRVAAALPPNEITLAGPETRELPPEWRWQRKAITFDHMFPVLR